MDYYKFNMKGVTGRPSTLEQVLLLLWSDHEGVHRQLLKLMGCV